MSDPPAETPAPLSGALRVLLYVLAGLTFVAGTQLFVLAEQTGEYWAWEIESAMTAAFVGAGFWSATVISYWAARQRDWVRARVPVPTILIVATLLLVATLEHFEAFQGLLGIAWIEVYALFPPIAIALVVRQLALGGPNPHSGDALPAGVRAALGVHAVLLVVVGVLLYAGSDGLRADLWPWELTPLTAKAVGTWLIGIGAIAGFIAIVDDRADLPGNSVAYLVLAAVSFLGLARFGGEVDFGSVAGIALLVFLASVLAAGLHGALLSLREGRYAGPRPAGGIPVELREPRR